MTERGPNGPTCVQVKLNGFFLLIVGHPWDKKGHRAAHILLLERYVWSKYEGSSDWTQLTDCVWMINRFTAQGRIDLVTWWLGAKEVTCSESQASQPSRCHWSKRSENSLASRLVQNVQIGTAKKCSKLLELLRAQYCLVKQCWLSRGLLLSVLRFYPTSDFITKMEWTNTAHDLTSLGISWYLLLHGSNDVERFRSKELSNLAPSRAK